MDGAQPDRAGGIVARPAGQHHVAAHAPALGQLRPQHAGGGTALHQGGHLARGEEGGAQRGRRPGAAADIEPQRAGSVRHFLDHLAGQPPAQPGLGQQHMGDGGEHLRLVLAHPEQLGGGEAGHGEVAGDGVQFRQRRLQLAALGGGAHVVPQDAGTQHGAVLVQQRRAVHLPGQADAPNRGEFGRMRGAQRVEHHFQGPPPSLGVLLAVAGRRAGNGERRSGGGERVLRTVNQDRLQRRSAEIDAEKHGRPLREGAITSTTALPRQPNPRTAGRSQRPAAPAEYSAPAPPPSPPWRRCG